jgi:hypothetical protein
MIREFYQACVRGLTGSDAACQICGSPRWTGMWIASRDIFVCRACALDALPALIADAVWDSTASAQEHEALAALVRARFLRAVAQQQRMRSEVTT